MLDRHGRTYCGESFAVPAVQALRVAAVSLMAAAALGGDDASSGRTIFLPFSRDASWVCETTGKFSGWWDRRNLFVLHHPWAESDAGRHATVSRRVSVPPDWHGPLQLHFYLTDDYDGQYPRIPKDSWLGQCTLRGHRYKQVLVNQHVVWQRDVADAEGVDQPAVFTVELPGEIKPGTSFTLSFRLADERSSRDRLEDDFRQVGSTEQLAENDPWKFLTHVYIGDVCITSKSAGDDTRRPVSPSVERARERHRRAGPPPLDASHATLPVAIPCQRSVESTELTWPVRCGIPFSAGAVRDPNEILFRNHSGIPQPSQCQVMNRWSDGSVRWVLLDTILNPADNDALRVEIRKADDRVVGPEHPVRARLAPSEFAEIETTGMRLVVGTEGGPLTMSFRAPRIALNDITPRMELESQTVTTHVESMEILDSGPLRAEVQINGRLEADDAAIGRFVVRVAGFSGQPYARLTWRVFNDTPRTLAWSRYDLVGQLIGLDGSPVQWGTADHSARGKVRLAQVHADKFHVQGVRGELLEEGRRAPGWVARTGEQGTLAVFVRHFAEQFPLALECNGQQLTISLAAGQDDSAAYDPTEGEAKRHEIWFGLWDRPLAPESLLAFAACAQYPPRFFDARYTCSSGALGRGAVHDQQQFAGLDAFMKQTYQDVGADRFYQFGIRDWGDQIYNRDEDYWCNGYYDRQHGFSSEYLMSGDPRWFDRLEATVRHIMDVDVCHASSRHPDWVGAIHGYSAPNHTGGPPWDVQQRIKGMLAYWRWTGDMDARDTALGVADSAVAANRGLGRTSVRDHAGILDCLMAAYDETRRPEYLHAAGRVAHDAMRRIDPRRGTYSEIHGNVSYRGNVPWMVAQLSEPLFEYYCHSGDLRAAEAVVGLAESILMENASLSVPGDVFGYSHNPHFKKTSSYHVLIAPAILYAHELTGDAYYLEAARAMYRQTVREGTVNSVVNCYWNTPALLYYLQRYGLAAETSP